VRGGLCLRQAGHYFVAVCKKETYYTAKLLISRKIGKPQNRKNWTTINQILKIVARILSKCFVA
jgi:hypothetical protein